MEARRLWFVSTEFVPPPPTQPSTLRKPGWKMRRRISSFFWNGSELSWLAWELTDRMPNIWRCLWVPNTKANTNTKAKRKTKTDGLTYTWVLTSVTWQGKAGVDILSFTTDSSGDSNDTRIPRVYPKMLEAHNWNWTPVPEMNVTLFFCNFSLC